MTAKLMLYEVILSEGILIPVDAAASLVANGIDIKDIEDRIDGFSVIDTDDFDPYTYIDENH